MALVRCEETRKESQIGSQGQQSRHRQPTGELPVNLQSGNDPGNRNQPEGQPVDPAQNRRPRLTQQQDEGHEGDPGKHQPGMLTETEAPGRTPQKGQQPARQCCHDSVAYRVTQVSSLNSLRMRSATVSALASWEYGPIRTRIMV